MIDSISPLLEETSIDQELSEEQLKVISHVIGRLGDESKGIVLEIILLVQNSTRDRYARVRHTSMLHGMVPRTFNTDKKVFKSRYEN